MPQPCLSEQCCRDYDPRRRLAAPAESERVPLCPACLEAAARDVRALILDYADLEQHLPKAASAVEHVSGTREPSIPIDVGVEALQRAIWLATTTWEEIIREVDALSPPRQRVRDGWATQHAVLIIEPRLRLLASLPSIAIMLAGPDAPPVHTTGAEAILIMCRLHATARAALGLTRLVHEMPGECPECGLPALRRDSGSEQVYCANCRHASTWDDYRRYVELTIQWHQR